MATDLVFVVGAPRSGTTWVQHLLGAHPDVVTPQELDLFHAYLSGWDDLWRSQLVESPDEWRRRRYKGLPAALTQDEFDDLLRDSARRVYAAVAALKPGARIVLDKVPNNGLHARLILRLFPEARFVHVIRDGRDVVASMIRASRGWGRFWAPRNAEVAAGQWLRLVNACREIAGLTPAYHEVRYEELAEGDTAALLGELFAAIRVEADEELRGRIVAESALSRAGESGYGGIVWGGEVRQRVAEPREPDGFAGEGGVGAWRRDLSRREVATVERVAGSVLAELGYAPETARRGRRRGLAPTRS